MLVVEPAGAEPDLEPAATHVVDLRGGDRQRPDRAEGHRGDERSEPDRGGVTRETGERDHRVGPGGGTRRAHPHVVVGPEERAVPGLLRGAGEREELVVGSALLGFGEDAQRHGAEIRTPDPAGDIDRAAVAPGTILAPGIPRAGVVQRQNISFPS